MYLGTYLSALYRNTEVLVLTFVGGGAFENPFDLILSTIAKVHIQVSPKSNLKQVILPIYDVSKSPDLIVKALTDVRYPSDKIKIIQQ
jgi:hypothetical protein